MIFEKKKQVTKFFCIAFFIVCISACSADPSKDVATNALKKILPMAFSIERISPVKGVSGLSEVVVIASGQPIVFYMDKKGAYVITGNVVDTQTKQNLTIESMQKFKDQKK